MKEVLKLQKHLMRFTIDCYKTHQTEASTMELYGEHFAEGQSEHKEDQDDSFANIHHIANNSDSDEYFLEDDEEETFSSLCPESVKLEKADEGKYFYFLYFMDFSITKHLEPSSKLADFHSIKIDKIFEDLTPENGRGFRKYKIENKGELGCKMTELHSNKAKSLSELEEYVFNIIHSRRNQKGKKNLRQMCE